MSAVQTFFWKVGAEEKSQRLDLFCIGKMQTVTRSSLKVGIKRACINGVECKLSKKVNPGDAVTLWYKPPRPDVLELFPYPLKILYEDANIIVVNKPSGMVTHPAGGHYTHTLVNALEFYRRNASSIPDAYSRESLDFTDGSLRRGIVHRLDKDTSGLLLTVRNEAAKNFYIDAFKKHAVKKYYLAILEKQLPHAEGVIQTSVYRSKKNRQRFSANEDLSCGKYALTKYKVLKTFGQYSLVLFRIYTGRTHQIRVHAKFMHSGIVGDALYTHDKKNRLMLHAYKLVFKTQDGKILLLKSKMPKRFKRFLAQNGAY